MITAVELSSRSRQDLAALARDHGIEGYRDMKKDDLVAAIRKAESASRRKTTAAANPKSTPAKSASGKSADPKSKTDKSAAVGPQAKVVKTVGTRQAAPSKSAETAKPATAVAPKAKKVSTLAVVSKASKPSATAKSSGKLKGSTPKAAESKSQVGKTLQSSAPNGKAVEPLRDSSKAKGPTLDRAEAKQTPGTKANESGKTMPKSATGRLVSKPVAASKAEVSSPKSSKGAKALQAGGGTPSSSAIDRTARGSVNKVGAKNGEQSSSKGSNLTSAPSEPKTVQLLKATAAVKNETGSKSPASSPKKVSATAKKPLPPPPPVVPVSAKSVRIRREMALRSQRALQNKDISTEALFNGSPTRQNAASSVQKDRIVLVVRDSFWLQAEWEITRAAVDRVRVAMSEKWHNAIPVLRVMAVADANANRTEQIVRDIPIHGGVSNWYIDVDEPPTRFRAVIGYVAENERFFSICRSNIVETPRPGAANRIDEHWRDIAEDYERVYSLSGGLDVNGNADLKEVFEDRLQRPMPVRGDAGLGSDTDVALDRHRALPFEVDAEMIIYGSTIPGATVMLGGDPVKLRPDGSFAIRVALPDKRQVFPVIAQSRDGMRQRTTVVAVERNTKVMEAVDRDSNF